MAIFKRLARPGEDQLAFVYPPFALLVLYPLILLPFDWAQAVWIAFLLLALVTSFALAFPRAPRWVGISLLAFYPVFFGLILGNFAILIAALLVILLAKYLPREKPSAAWQIGAGILAGWLTVKPQFTWPFLLFLLPIRIAPKALEIPGRPRRQLPAVPGRLLPAGAQLAGRMAGPHHSLYRLQPGLAHRHLPAQRSPAGFAGCLADRRVRRWPAWG